MEFDSDDLQNRIRNPQESLNTELKCWIAPTSPAGRAKIAKGCIALRNANGGHLIIGFNNDGTPDTTNVPSNVRATFHVDVIQGIIGEFAAHPFEIRVEFPNRDGTEYPVIIVPSGVETPVATKRELPDPTKPKPLVKSDIVYVRTLNSNNTVSTSEASYRDWERITKVCFDNREANIGAFVRRHLAGLDLEKLGLILGASKPKTTATETAVAFLDTQWQRFEAKIGQRKISIPNVGFREVAVVIEGDVPEAESLGSFMDRLQFAKPNHTGWTPWTDSRRSRDDEDKPAVISDGWEALLVQLDKRSDWGTHIDFWRMEPSGKFYHLRALEEDMFHPRLAKPEPKTQLDFLLQITRTAEIMSVALSFARSIGCVEQGTSLVFAFRWSGIAKRILTSIAEPMRGVISMSPSQESKRSSFGSWTGSRDGFGTV